MFFGMKDSMADEIRANRTDDRLAGLLDSAQAHLQANQPDRAMSIWDQMIEAGGEEGDWGHLEYADYLLRFGRGQDANEHFARLMVGQRHEGEPWRLTAELLEERGDREAALLWFSAGGRHLSADNSEESRRAQLLRAGRRRLRWVMGIPLDDDDLLAEIGVREMDDKWFDLLRLMGEPEVIEGRLQFWDRDDFEYALTLWPAQIVATNADEYYQKIEGVLRAHAGDQVAVVPRGVQAWIRGVEATNIVASMDELRLFASRLDDGQTAKWPPAYDQDCWCGSGTKYADCCGASGMLVSVRSG
jgi:tetratricopeptide (TPR) repeat protein